MSDFVSELRRRSVVRVGIAYAVAAWLLAQVADLVLDAFHAPGWILRALLLLLGLGFPLALLLAWAFEITPEGVRRDREAGAKGPHAGRRLNVAIVAVLGLALGLFVVQRLASTSWNDAEGAERPSIAAIPFENLSGDAANLPFTRGIHDDLLTQLSKISSIKTISRTSVLRYRETTQSVPEIAAELGVSTVLAGGVQRSGDRVRINVRLVDAAHDETLWAETYDRELSAANLFAVQSEIAASIAETLRVTLSAGEQERLDSVPTRSLEALDIYFRGKQMMEERSRPSLEAAVRYFERVIELDPNFALAWSGLADATMILPEYSTGVDLAAAQRRSALAAKRALELDPEIPEVLASMAWNRLIHDYDWSEAERLLRKAVEIQPNNTSALHWLSHVLSWQGRHAEAIRWARQAVEVDPLSPLMHTNLSYIYMDAGDFEQSTRAAERTLELDEGYTEVVGNLFFAQLRAGRAKQAAVTVQRWAEGTGRDTEATRELGRLLAAHARGEPVSLPEELLLHGDFVLEDRGQIHAYFGDEQRTLASLEQAVRERSGARSVLSMKVNPLYDFLRGDARFQELLRRAGLAQ